MKILPNCNKVNVSRGTWIWFRTAESLNTIIPQVRPKRLSYNSQDIVQLARCIHESPKTPTDAVISVVTIATFERPGECIKCQIHFTSQDIHPLPHPVQ
jgi:hypothetical protein